MYVYIYICLQHEHCIYIYTYLCWLHKDLYICYILCNSQDVQLYSLYIYTYDCTTFDDRCYVHMWHISCPYVTDLMSTCDTYHVQTCPHVTYIMSMCDRSHVHMWHMSCPNMPMWHISSSYISMLLLYYIHIYICI